jgi:putative ABC transport system permease protein
VLKRFFRRAWWDEERARELESYLEIETDANLARGMSRADARAAARRKLGSATRVREEIYAMNTIALLDSAWQDLRFGLRLLRRNPTFAAVAVLTLALGTGANAAVFQLIDALRLRPLPVAHPSELVSVDIDLAGGGRVGWGMNRRAILTEPLWRALDAHQQAFSRVFAYGITRFDLSTDGDRSPARGLYLSGGFFDGLGVRPAAGRLIGDADDQPGCSQPGAVLSHAFWRTHYAADPSVLGRTISLDGRAFPVVGVAARGFSGVEVGRGFDVALPLCAEPLVRGTESGTGHGDRWFIDALGRLRPGWTVQQADAQLRAVSARIFETTVPPTYNADMAREYRAFRFTARPAATGVSGLRRQYGTHLWVLLGATALVLLVACANLANLMLARATAREREVALRLALGASRRRIVRQMVVESLVLALAGAAGGLALARVLGQALLGYLGTPASPIVLDLALDWRVFGFVALVALGACLIFGVTPALSATAAAPGLGQAGGRTHTDSRRGRASRQVLVVAQVALSLVLVAGALLFGRSLQRLAAVEPGFRTDGVVVMSVDLSRAGVSTDARAGAAEDLLSRVRAVPGVSGAAQTLVTPLSGAEWNGRILVEGAVQGGMVNFDQVSGDYFRTLEIPLVAGRTFGGQDRVGSPEVAVVNQAFARKYLPGGSPVGRTFQMETGPGRPQPLYRVVGVVGDTRYRELREEQAPIAFLAAAQEKEPPPLVGVVVRTNLPQSAVRAALTREARSAVAGATVTYDTLAARIHDSLAAERLMASLSGFFGALALIIAAVGLYGVVAYSVSRREVEIGVRMALGATGREVVRMVLREAGVLVGIGVAFGIVMAALASRWAQALLFGLSAADPLSLALAAVVLAAATVLAAWVPARRVARLDPMHALRSS